MRNDTCGEIPYFLNMSNETTHCENFLSGILTQGLHATIIMFFEQLRTTLINFSFERSQYEHDRELYKHHRLAILDTEEMRNLYIIQNYVIQNLMRELVEQLSDSIQQLYSYTIERKIAIFICFLIVILIAFFLFWLPFLNDLNF
mmetsp:Transcript_20727/g.19775  ORF Transcript_20727/g.19775 Transcript_20727/m.19775 type:complete len:145 (+) Transcript_20727:2249-2683(+)